MTRALITSLVAALALTAAAHAEPTRFAPGAITLDGRITLTPGFSPDGRTAYYAQSECGAIARCPQTLHRAEFRDGAWQRGAPVALPATGRVDWPSVTPDGRTLLFSWSAKRAKYDGLDLIGDFDLYRLDLTQPGAVPEPLDFADMNRPRAGAIKTRRHFHNSTGPIMSRDGDIYFWTERADGVGERDLYVAPRKPDGEYAISRPLPGPVNTTARDHLFWISPDETLLLVTYRNRDGRTGNDIYVSRKTASGWSTPASLGPRINTRYDEFAPRVTPDGKTLVFTSDRPFDGTPAGLMQVWQIPIAELVDDGVLEAGDFD